MKRLERVNDETMAALALLEGNQACIWTCLPAEVVSVSLGAGGKMTCEVQPLIQAQLTVEKVKQWVTMPLCVDCPIMFPSGGGFTLTFPVKPGDEGLLIFSSRCIDAWWQSGGVQPQADLRMHDLSDGFFLPGVKSLPNVIEVDPNNVQLRTDDGDALVEITPAKVINITTTANVNVNAGGNVTVEAQGDASVLAQGTLDLASVGDMTLQAPHIIMLGDVAHGGDFASDGGTFKHNGTNVGSTHKHSGVNTGGGNTGNPLP